MIRLCTGRQPRRPERAIDLGDSGVVGGRESDTSGRAPAQLTLDADLRPHRVGERLHDRQPETRPLGPDRPVTLGDVQPLEHPGKIMGVDPRPRVGDSQLRRL